MSKSLDQSAGFYCFYGNCITLIKHPQKGQIRGKHIHIHTHTLRAAKKQHFRVPMWQKTALGEID